MTDSSSEPKQTLSLPSLAIFAVVSFFVIRWLLSSRTSTSPTSLQYPGRGGPQRRRVDPAQVEQIAQMFPQLGRREIMWDLQRNGGSVAATTERVLGGRGLEAPPPSFQPTLAPPSTPASNSSTSAGASNPSGPDLISRYNLNSKVSSSPTNETEIGSTGTGWSSNKSERQQLLQRRREEMILNARRKLQEKDRTRPPA